MANVPKDWLPFTRVTFVGIEDQKVQEQDSQIRLELGESFRALSDAYGYQPTWRDIKMLAFSGDSYALRILTLCGDRLRLFESFGSSAGKLNAVKNFISEHETTLVLTRFRRSAERIAQALTFDARKAFFAHGGMDRRDVGKVLEEFRQQSEPGLQSLVLTRELGGRGLDFPLASGVSLFSPRSNYQAVAQELAGIRSRAGSPKEALIPYYRNTEEEAKARRLGIILRRERYGQDRLFEVISLPGTEYKLKEFEGRLTAYEETKLVARLENQRGLPVFDH
jgi:superfamily II DNA/RNA helicase